MKHKLFLFLSCSILFCCCHKITKEEVVGRINDGEVYVLGNNYATLKLSIFSKDLDNIGVCYSENSSAPLYVDSVTHALFYDYSEDSYFVRIENLKELTTYYWRTFIKKEHVFVYGEVNRFTTTGPPTGSWTQMADFFAARDFAVGFSIGDKGYVGTGHAYPWNMVDTHKDFWEYDPATNTWTQKADFGGGERAGAVGFSIGDRGYVGTGYFADYSDPEIPSFNDFWEYNPVANEWTQKADLGGEARSEAVGFSIGDKGYIGTGRSKGRNSLKDLWEYDPESNSWQQKKDLPGSTNTTVRNGAIGFSIGNKGYVGLGYRVHSSRDFWEYDPLSDNWVQKAAPTGTGRARAVGFSIGNKGYVGLGEWHLTNFETTTNEFWEYTPDLDVWTLKESYPGSGRITAVGFSIGDKGYVGTGCRDILNDWAPQKDFWRFTP
jgi:N-acetylneuraminic acid mutarotase